MEDSNIMDVYITELWRNGEHTRTKESRYIGEKFIGGIGHSELDDPRMAVLRITALRSHWDAAMNRMRNPEFRAIFKGGNILPKTWRKDVYYPIKPSFDDQSTLLNFLNDPLEFEESMRYLRELGEDMRSQGIIDSANKYLSS